MEISYLSGAALVGSWSWSLSIQWIDAPCIPELAVACRDSEWGVDGVTNLAVTALELLCKTDRRSRSTTWKSP